MSIIHKLVPLVGPNLFEWAFLLRAVFTLLAIFFICSFLYHEYRKRQQYATLPTISTSWLGGFIVGHLEHFLLSNTKLDVTVFFGDILNGLTRMWHQNKEGLIYLRAGPFRHFVGAFSAKTAEAILADTKNIQKAVEYDFIRSWLGQGLLTGGGQHWKKHRKLLTPTFHFQILNKFIPVMNNQLGTLCSIIESKMNPITGKTVIEDIRPVVTNCTVDIICQTAMGIKVNAQHAWIELSKLGSDHTIKTPELEYADSVREYLDIVLERFMNPLMYPNLIFQAFALGRRSKKLVETMHMFTNNVIIKRKAIMEKKFDYSLSVEESIKKLSEGSRLDFLDLLLVYHLKDQNGFDLVSIREEVDTFMFGGHDTTSTTLHFALLLLGLNPDKQNLIHQEVDTIFADDMKRDITLEDTKKMTYIEMCIKETLRLYPPAAFFGRIITSDLQCDKYFVPAGTTFMVYSYAVHRDPEVYQKPEHFIPERFAPNTNVARNPFAFIPFSAGARNCIGQRFAMLEAKIFIATVLRKYHLRSITQRDNILVDFAIISKSHTPISIEFTPRQIPVKIE